LRTCQGEGNAMGRRNGVTERVAQDRTRRRLSARWWSGRRGKIQGRIGQIERQVRKLEDCVASRGTRLVARGTDPAEDRDRAPGRALCTRRQNAARSDRPRTSKADGSCSAFSPLNGPNSRFARGVNRRFARRPRVGPLLARMDSRNSQLVARNRRYQTMKGTRGGSASAGAPPRRLAESPSATGAPMFGIARAPASLRTRPHGGAGPTAPSRFPVEPENLRLQVGEEVGVPPTVGARSAATGRVDGSAPGPDRTPPDLRLGDLAAVAG